MQPDARQVYATPVMNRLAVVCDTDACITEILLDDTGILGEEALERPLTRALVPSGIAPFIILMTDLGEDEIVSNWMLEFRQAGAPVVYHCAVARAGQSTLIVGARDPLTSEQWRVVCAEIREPLASLAARMAERAGDKDACIADARRQIAVLQEQTKLPSRLENELIRVAAHDLRNPLLVIKMNCSFILQRGRTMDAVERGMLEDMLETCEFMGRFLDGMTSLSRVWVGELDLQREQLDAAHLVRSVVRRSVPIAATRGIRVELENADSVDVYVDRRKLLRVLHELFSNAIRFCPEGATVRANLTRASEPKRAVICVQDDGPGMSQLVRQTLFRPFGKSPNDGVWGYGAGVGLPIARRIVEAHGGTLHVHSREGEGTRVEIELPLP